MEKKISSPLIHFFKNKPYVWSSLLAFSVSIIAYFNGLLAISTDCISRTYFAYAWSNHPTIYQTSIWLPFHSIFYGSFMKVDFFSEIGIAHFFNALFSAGIIWISALIVATISSHKKAILFICIALLFSSMRIWLGFSMLSEPPYIFFFLSFIYVCIRYFQTKNEVFFYLSIILGFFISGYRFSSWPIIFAYSIIILYQKRTLKHWIACLCMHAFQIYWLYIIYRAYGNPFSGFNLHAKDSVDFYENGTHPIIFILKNYSIFFSFGALLSMLGLWQWKHIQPSTQKFTIFSIILTMIQSLVIFRFMPTVLPERAIFLSGICLTISAVLIFYDLTNHYPNKTKPLYSIVFILLILNIFAVLTVQPNPKVPMQPVAEALRKIPGWSSAQNWYIAHDTDRLEGMSLILLSKKPERFILLKFDASKKQIQLQSQKKPIALFLLKSKETAEHIHKNWPDSFLIKNLGYYFVSTSSQIKQHISP